MAWLAVDYEGSEWVFDSRPQRMQNEWRIIQAYNMFIELPQGTIKKLIGRKLSWSDEPVKI